LLVTVNIKKFPREYLDQVISNPEARTAAGACTWSGPFFKRRASSLKPQKRQASSRSVKRLAKRLAKRSVKHQAINVGPIVKRQAWRFAMIAQQT
jgi:hypothetical protein